MTNKEVANKFKLLGDLMELHKENPFKFRSYHNAYRVIRAQPSMVIEQDLESLESIKGIGKAIADKIHQLRDTGTIVTLERQLEKTPEGIVQLLGVKGIGAKKIATLWNELDIQSPGELLYACQENRLVEVKGFGEKTQSKLKDQLEYYLANADNTLYAIANEMAQQVIAEISTIDGVEHTQVVGDLIRQNPVVESIEIAAVIKDAASVNTHLESLDYVLTDGKYHHETYGTFTLHLLDATSDIKELCYPKEDSAVYQVFTKSDIADVPYHMQELTTIEYLQEHPDAINKTIQQGDLKGCIHNHTTASDGSHTLEQMVDQAATNGYEYLVISDHSKSAFYANGLSEERLLDQGRQIDQINSNRSDIKVYKSVESDILNDGRLDYEPNILNQLDLVIASVHSNLTMDIDKATNRLVTAIEHPATKILGHPSGRLLLARKGYPLDYEKIIDACAANGVVIELNANPHRLDMDWMYLYHCIKKNVMISINPDAHHRDTYTNMQYGVLAAQKAAFPTELVLNTKTLEEFEAWVNA
jgi:DNA polymerase (family 10)